MKAIVVGGTGVVGRALLAELSADAVYGDVASLARRAGPTLPKVRHLAFDAELPEADVAFCALGTTIAKAGSQDAFRAVDHGLVLRFARACRERGIGSFHVVSAAGADPDSRIFYNRVKGEMERDLRALGFPAACAYRPSLLMAERDERRPGERAGILAMRALGGIVPRKWRGIPAETVARSMARHARSGPTGWHVHENDELFEMGAG